MRSGFLAACLFLCFSVLVRAQGSLPPSVTTQPVNVNAYVGDTVTLTTAIGGTAPLALQWYKDGAPIPGATAASYSIANVALSPGLTIDGALYYLVATNAFGTITTAPAVITITKRPQAIAFTAPAVAAAGSGVVLNATSSLNQPITFTLLSGAASLSGNVLTGAGGSVVVRANQAGTAAIAAADPVDRTINFVAGVISPFISSPPVDQTVTAGASVTFRASTIGTPAPTYQWQKDDVTLAGATGATLTLAATTLADSGRYTVLATNLAGTATASATLTVRAAPMILQSPADQSVFAGNPARFAVTVTGFPAPTYQWRKNGAALAGATNATLALAGALAGDAGRYDVVVTNALGSATSSVATLVITTRDFSGVYFGQFSGLPIAAAATITAAGNFALLVRPDRTAVFLGYLTGQLAGVIALNLNVDLSGAFSLPVTTIAATPRTVPLGGTIDDVAGTVTGSSAQLNVRFDGTRQPRTGPAAAQADFYLAAAVGSADGQVFAIVAPNGRTFLLLTSGGLVDSGSGTIGANGRLALTTAGQTSVDLGFNSGLLTGTARTAAGTAPLSGAIASLVGTEHVVNFSVRTTAQPGTANLIAGFVISGTTQKQVLIRAAGPALAAAPFNVPGVLADPALQLFRGSNIIAQNDDWDTPAANAAAITTATTRAGAFPFRNGSTDAAILTRLAPGAYTAVVSGGTGAVLAEVYEALENNEIPGTRRLVNVSARGLVAPTLPFIGGFVLTGTVPQRVLIRGIGPSLGAAPFNVAGVLGNPQLTLFRGSTPVKTNNNWFRDPDAALIRDAAARTGAFPLGANASDAAMLIYLDPGAYTAQITGPANQANGVGLALLEIYEAP